MVLRVCIYLQKYKILLAKYVEILYTDLVSEIEYSSIAQSVEHAAVNRAVVGSSPTRGVL